MASRTATIGSTSGLHSRPAALFAKAAAKTGHAVTVTAHGKTADGRSLLAIMTLGAKNGDDVVLDVDGADAERVADELVALLSSDLDAA